MRIQRKPERHGCQGDTVCHHERHGVIVPFVIGGEPRLCGRTAFSRAFEQRTARAVDLCSEGECPRVGGVRLREGSERRVERIGIAVITKRGVDRLLVRDRAVGAVHFRERRHLIAARCEAETACRVVPLVADLAHGDARDADLARRFTAEPADIRHQLLAVVVCIGDIVRIGGCEQGVGFRSHRDVVIGKRTDAHVTVTPAQ